MFLCIVIKLSSDQNAKKLCDFHNLRKGLLHGRQEFDDENVRINWFAKCEF